MLRSIRHLALLLLLPLPLHADGRPEVLEREVEEGGVVRRAHATWWRLQRAFPAEHIPEAALRDGARAFAALQPQAPAGAALATQPLWIPLGPSPLMPPAETPNSGPIAGRLAALALHPRDPKQLYVGAAQGGLWKSSDGGATWSPLGDEQPALAVGAIAIDPRAPDTLYVGTGEPIYFGYYGEGLLKSTDGGRSFTRPAGNRFAGAATSRIVIDPQSGALYLATTAAGHGAGDACTAYYPKAPDLGLYRSDDGGASWRQLLAGAINDFEVDLSTQPRTFYVVLQGRGAVTFAEGSPARPLPLPDRTANPPAIALQLALSPSQPKILYAGIGFDKARAAIYASTDGGRSFTLVPGAPNYCYSQCDFSNVLTVHPTDPTTLFVGGGVCSVFRATQATSAQPVWRALALPGGVCKSDFSNWHEHFVHPDAHALALSADGRTLYAATDGGLARTSDGGASWEALNQGLSTIQLYGLCQSAKEPARLWGGAQDNGLMATTKSGWEGLLTGDGGPCVADVTSQEQPLPHPLLSEIFGVVLLEGERGLEVTFNAYPGYCRPNEPGCGDRVAFIAPLVGDPSRPSVLYLGTHRLWRSSDGGAAGSWAPISGDLTGGALGVKCNFDRNGDDYLTAIAVARSSGKTLYTGSAGGVVSRSSDGGSSWTRVSAALPRRWVSALAVDPLDASTVYVAYSGFSSATPDRPGHVFRSRDGGATWQPRDPPLDLPIDSLLAHPTEPGVLWAGSDAGVLATVDGGASWTPLGGLPGAAVYALTYHAATATLTAGTHGRGVFRRQLTAALTARPAQLAFQRRKKVEPIPPQTITVQNGDRSGSLLRFSVDTDVTWLTATPEQGRSAGGEVAVTVSALPDEALPPGEYDGRITLRDPDATDSPLAIPVHLSIARPGCGCRVGGSSAPSGLLLLGGALVLVRLRRRRRA